MTLITVYNLQTLGMFLQAKLFHSLRDSGNATQQFFCLDAWNLLYYLFSSIKIRPRINPAALVGN